MISFLETVLSEFRSCFSRKAAYRWFVVVILGLLTRMDKLGVTSFIRALSINGQHYECMLHFFRSSAYTLDGLKTKWYSILKSSDCLLHFEGRIFLAGDGTKTAKEGKHMPGVQKLYQESENCSKAPYIFGHMFGGLAALIGNSSAYFAAPISMDIHLGLSSMSNWDDSLSNRSTSHVVRMIENAFEAAQHLGKAYLCLDRYFLAVPALKRLAELCGNEDLLHIITRAKMNCIAYEEPDIPPAKKRGRPRKKGKTMKLAEFFESEKDRFVETTASLYGSEETISYLCKDLLWGTGLYKKLRFVLVKRGNTRGIFVSTDLTLNPVKIVEAYAKRFSIESTFKELKQQIGGFSYHFWTKALPKLNRYKKKEEADNLSKVVAVADRERVKQTVVATERFVLFSCIAIGLAQMIALNEKFTQTLSSSRYLRTPARTKQSEGTVISYLQKNLFRLLLSRTDSELTRIILRVMDTDSELQNDNQVA